MMPVHLAAIAPVLVVLVPRVVHQALPRAITVSRIGHRMNNIVLFTAGFTPFQVTNLLPLKWALSFWELSKLRIVSL